MPPRLTAAVSTLLLALACGGCGTSSPHGVVASVAGVSVTRAALTHWLQVETHSEQATASVQLDTVPPVPPRFSACVKAQRADSGLDAPGRTARAQASCKRRYLELREAAFGFLIHAAWITAEARARHIQSSPQLLEEEFARLRRVQFPGPGTFAAYLKRSGQTEQDLFYRMKVDVLLQRIEREVVDGVPAPSSGAVASYYRANRNSFLTPERREVGVVRASARRPAQQARRRLEGGASFASVAASYGGGPGGGRGIEVMRAGEATGALARAFFAAPVGRLEGPLAAPGGVYVFKVLDVSPPTRETPAEATQAVRGQLLSAAQQRALSAFTTSFDGRWRARTSCEPELRVAQYCAGVLAGS